MHTHICMWWYLALLKHLVHIKCRGRGFVIYVKWSSLETLEDTCQSKTKHSDRKPLVAFIVIIPKYLEMRCLAHFRLIGHSILPNSGVGPSERYCTPNGNYLVSIHSLPVTLPVFPNSLLKMGVHGSAQLCHWVTGTIACAWKNALKYWLWHLVAVMLLLFIYFVYRPICASITLGGLQHNKIKHNSTTV